MAYYTKVLQPDETVKVVGRLHWSIYLRALVVLVLAMALLVFAERQPDPDWQRTAQWAAGVVGALGLLLLLAAWIRRLGTEIVVTDRRVILNHGLLTRRTMEMNMSKIEMVDVQQSLWGRIWGYGTVKIHGTGVDIEALKSIGSPLAIRNAIVVG
jgi:membrane protein YdbS with pleckstrin-like domain